MFQRKKFRLLTSYSNFKLKILLAGRSFYLLMRVFYYPSCVVSILCFTLYFTNIFCLSDINPMSWSCCRYCSILRPCLGARICRWQRGRATWSYTLTFRQFRQISYGSAESLSSWQQCYCILLYFNQSPSVHPYFGCSASICILGCGNCYVSDIYFII